MYHTHVLRAVHATTEQSYVQYMQQFHSLPHGPKINQKLRNVCVSIFAHSHRVLARTNTAAVQTVEQLVPGNFHLFLGTSLPASFCGCTSLSIRLATRYQVHNCYNNYLPPLVLFFGFMFIHFYSSMSHEPFVHTAVAAAVHVTAPRRATQGRCDNMQYIPTINTTVPGIL